jgi:hypothetical protein
MLNSRTIDTLQLLSINFITMQLVYITVIENSIQVAMNNVGMKQNNRAQRRRLHSDFYNLWTIFFFIHVTNLVKYSKVFELILDNSIIIILISILRPLLLGHRPFFWIPHKENGP